MNEPLPERPDADEEISIPELPSVDDLIGTVRFAVSFRVAGRKILDRSGEGRLLGRLVVRLSELSASVIAGGSNVSIAVERAPVNLIGLRFGHSVDLQFVVRDDPDLFKGDGDEIQDLAASTLASLTTADDEQFSKLLAETSGAVATSWRHTINLLDVEDCDLSFATSDSKGGQVTSKLAARDARAQVSLLSRQHLSTRATVNVTGVLDALNDRRESFEMMSPQSFNIASKGLQESWSAALGKKRTLKGDLTPDARVQARTLNAWSKLVDATVEITTLKTATGTEDTEVVLRSIDAVHEELEV